MKYKIWYHIGDTINISTRYSLGLLFFDSAKVIIQGESRIEFKLEDVIAVQRHSSLASSKTIKVIFSDQILYLEVYRLNLFGWIFLTHSPKTNHLFKELLNYLEKRDCTVSNYENDDFSADSVYDCGIDTKENRDRNSNRIERSLPTQQAISGNEHTMSQMAVQSREGIVRSDMRDIFLSHAWEDKEDIVNPLFRLLENQRISCWYDRAEIKLGDSVTQKVNEGLYISRFVLVVLSIRSLGKPWPQGEFHAALNLESVDGRSKVIPLICGSHEEREYILAKLPFLRDKLFLVWDNNQHYVVSQLLTHLERKGTPLLRACESQFENHSKKSRPFNVVKPEEVIEPTSIIFKLGENYLKQANLFLFTGVSGLFISMILVIMIDLRAIIYLFVPAWFFCVLTGILLHNIGDLYKKTHVRHPFIPTHVTERPYFIPFSGTWRKMWAANEPYPELRKAMILWVTAMISAIIMIIFLILTVLAIPS